MRKNLLRSMAAGLAFVALCAMPALAQKGGKSGTTLAASKTIDICEVPDTTPVLWRYSGEISVWNAGAVETEGLEIKDCIQNKVGSGQFTDAFCDTYVPSLQIPAGAALPATVFSYSFDKPALDGNIRNAAAVTIKNHSGSLGTAKGPEPKATWLGPVAPCALPDTPPSSSCVNTQGYWGSKPGIVWPVGFNRTDPFFLSGLTWQQILNEPVKGRAYIQLADQYIAAVLNQARGEDVPSGVQTVLDDSKAFFATALLDGGGGTQTTWAGILNDYNNGRYPGGPRHCGNDK